MSSTARTGRAGWETEAAEHGERSGIDDRSDLAGVQDRGFLGGEGAAACADRMAEGLSSRGR